MGYQNRDLSQYRLYSLSLIKSLRRKHRLPAVWALYSPRRLDVRSRKSMMRDMRIMAIVMRHIQKNTLAVVEQLGVTK